MKYHLLLFFITGLITGSYAQTNTFPTDGNVGIGTTSPSAKLDVNGIGNFSETVQSPTLRTNYLGKLWDMSTNGSDFYVSETGINTWLRIEKTTGNSAFLGSVTAPTFIGDLTGNAATATSWGGWAANFGSQGSTPDYILGYESGTSKPYDVNKIKSFLGIPSGGETLQSVTDRGGTTTHGIILPSLTVRNASKNWDLVSDANNFYIQEAGVDTWLTVAKTNGNVGIGTTNPSEKLSVNGKIRAHEIKVELTGWSDFVFAKDYKLPTLQETEKHIKDKGHLPGIPSAEEVKANGVDLGEMNAKLLQKIEELTLLLIEQNKRLIKLETSNKMNP